MSVLILIFVVFTICANGNHDVVTKYGMVGILTAVFCFPIGLLALLYVSHMRIRVLFIR